MTFESEMMNIPSPSADVVPEGYLEGHRTARHRAAEIAVEADAEIERLRGMLVAHDIDPDCEYIAKGGLRVNAPASNCEPKF